jgi:hypothetical protein
MHRLNLRVVGSVVVVAGLLACGGSGEPSHGWPDEGNAAAATSGASTVGPGPGTGGSSNPSAGGSGNPSTAGNGPSAGSGLVPQGGSSSTAGTSPGLAGSSGAPAATNEYWLSPDGLDTNPGTEAAPLKTLVAAVKKSKPGVTFWLKPGTYPSTATIDIIFAYSGTEAAPIKLFAAPGGRPKLDFSTQPAGSEMRGLDVLANYWHIKGLEIMKSADNCIAIAGSHNIVEDVITHECGDTGIQITAPSSQATDDNRAAHNQILNCDSWGNLDGATGGENADGFAAKLRIGPGNVFRGCRAWNNADDGWDLFASDDVVTIDDCWAFSNGKPINGSNPQGDGNGFKLGGEPNGEGQGGAVHLVSNSFAFENESCGFVRNNNPSTPKLTGCGAKSNGDAYCELSVSGEKSMSMSASTARTIAREADGSLPPMQ